MQSLWALFYCKEGCGLDTRSSSVPDPALGLPDPDPQLLVRIRILTSTSKQTKETLISTFSEILMTVISEDWCTSTLYMHKSKYWFVISKKKLREKIILLTSWKPLTKKRARSGSGSVIQCTDPTIRIRIRLKVSRRSGKLISSLNSNIKQKNIIKKSWKMTCGLAWPALT